MKKILVIILLYLFIPNIVFAANKQISVKLESCIDGDTANFIMNKKTVKVRFLAVDTPETKHPKKHEEPYGKEASQFTCDTLKNAKKISLEFDAGSDEKDKYDRYLAWIIVDNKILQEQLVSKGLAKVAYLYGNYKYTDKLQKLEKQAKQERIGIWSDYEEKANYSITLLIFSVLVIITICIFNKKYRNKTKRKLKTKVSNYLKKQIKKSNLFK